MKFNASDIIIGGNVANLKQMNFKSSSKKSFCVSEKAICNLLACDPFFVWGEMNVAPMVLS